MKIGIIGAGPLGKALAINLGQNHETILYSKGELKGINELEIIFITVDFSGLEKLLSQLASLQNKSFLIICTKGLGSNGEFLYDLAKNMLKHDKIAFLFGPSFAHEILNYDKTYVNLVYHNYDYANEIIALLNNESLKMVVITDYIGAQLCAAMKNICAIYLGVAKGNGAKNDHLAALFTFFIGEIKKTIEFHGGQEETIFDLCGIGDLFLTCTSFESRNYNFGYQIGIAKSLAQSLINCNNKYPEGYYALRNLTKLNNNNNFSIPLCTNLYKILFENADINLL